MLLDRVYQGDDAAFGTLYRRVSPMARRAAHNIVRDSHAADDLVQETFYLVLRAVRSGRGPRDSFAGYVLATVKHLAYRYCKTESRTVANDDPDMWERHTDIVLPRRRRSGSRPRGRRCRRGGAASCGSSRSTGTRRPSSRRARADAERGLQPRVAGAAGVADGVPGDRLTASAAAARHVLRAALLRQRTPRSQRRCQGVSTALGW